jgi:hypothetical protein
MSMTRVRRQCRLDGGERRADARIARHFAILDGYVQILADQHPLALEIQVGHFYDLHP